MLIYNFSGFIGVTAVGLQSQLWDINQSIVSIAVDNISFGLVGGSCCYGDGFIYSFQINLQSTTQCNHPTIEHSW